MKFILFSRAKAPATFKKNTIFGRGSFKAFMCCSLCVIHAVPCQRFVEASLSFVSFFARLQETRAQTGRDRLVAAVAEAVGSVPHDPGVQRRQRPRAVSTVRRAAFKNRELEIVLFGPKLVTLFEPKVVTQRAAKIFTFTVRTKRQVLARSSKARSWRTVSDSAERGKQSSSSTQLRS